MSRKRIKQYLMLLTAVGVVAVAASGAGTFATFNAEVQNNGNQFTAGTLFLHNTANGNTCTSEQATGTGNNANNGTSWTDTSNGCTILFDANIGNATLDTKLSSAITAGDQNSIAVNATNAAVSAGDELVISDGSTTDTVIASADAAKGATSISIYNETLDAFNTPASTTVTDVDTTHFATLALNNAGSLAASDLKFYVPGCTDGNPVSYDLGTPSAANYANPNTTFTISAAPADVSKGQSVTMGSNTYTVASFLAKGGTSLVVNGDHHSDTLVDMTYAPIISSESFCDNAQITVAETDSAFDLTTDTNKTPVCVYGPTDTTVFGCKFAGATDLSAVPTSAGTATALPLVSGSSTGDVGNGNSGTGLDAGGTRYFLIGVSLPASTTNDYQNHSATFGLGWHIDAA